MLKLQGTRCQRTVSDAGEEELHAAVAAGERDLELVPVVACELHSQVPAVAAGFLACVPEGRVAYVMTDGATLSIDESGSVPIWQQEGLVHLTVTVGQCCGGDVEAVSLYSGLLHARLCGRAQFIIVAQGPGEVDLGTRFGFSGIGQGEALNAAASLGGRPLLCLRTNERDVPESHSVPHEHTLTVLDRIVRCRCAVPIARDAPGKRRRLILSSLEELQLHERHDVLTDHRGEPGLKLMESRHVPISSADGETLLHASAAGAAAAEMLDNGKLRMDSG